MRKIRSLKPQHTKKTLPEQVKWLCNQLDEVLGKKMKEKILMSILEGKKISLSDSDSFADIANDFLKLPNTDGQSHS